MNWEVELFVELKVPDVVALTARETLWRRLGWEDKLEDLTRADYWRLTIEAGSEQEAEEFARELVERTALFINPNKHRYSLRVRPSSDREEETSSSASSEQGGERQRVRVLTGFDEDVGGALTLQALRTRYGWGERVHRIERGTLWVFVFRTSDAMEARRWAEAITLTRSRQYGLLVNPHSQWWRWLE